MCQDALKTRPSNYSAVSVSLALWILNTSSQQSDFKRPVAYWNYVPRFPSISNRILRLQFLSCAGMIIVTTESLHVFLLRTLCASVFSRLERQAGLPFEEWLIFLLNKGQHVMAKNAGH